MSIIDYGLIGEENLDLIEDFQIQDKGQHLLDVDHSPLVVELKDDERSFVATDVKLSRVLQFPDFPYWTTFTKVWEDKYSEDEESFENLTLEEQNNLIVKDAVDACESTIPQKCSGYVKDKQKSLGRTKMISEAIKKRQNCGSDRLTTFAREIKNMHDLEK